MDTTRGNLKAAVIYDFARESASTGVICMFNPYEYQVRKSNNFMARWENSKVEPEMEFTGSTEKTLTLNLLFDTYETGEDVSQTTAKLWAYMKPLKKNGEGEKYQPPTVVFEWGEFNFKAVISSLTEKFTLFTKKGTPVRSKITINFRQHDDPQEKPPPPQNPTSGSDTIHEVRHLVYGDRLDLIAAEVYGDATKWRLIAERNNIDNPARLQPGQRLIIPEGQA